MMHSACIKRGDRNPPGIENNPEFKIEILTTLLIGTTVLTSDDYCNCYRVEQELMHVNSLKMWEVTKLGKNSV